MSKVDNANLFARAKKVTPGGVHSPVRSFKGLDRAPVFFTSGEGPFLFSADGQKYIDFCMSFGPLILGHRDPDVSEVVHSMVNRAWTFGACEPYSLELAEWITERIPWVEKLRFVSSGTEAVMSALRVARAATGRKKILKFEGCYHGHVDSLLVQAGSGLAGISASSSAGISEATASETLVSPLDSLETVETIFAREGKDIAAVILEPLPANYGLLVQREDFIRSVCDVARKHGALVIFDEVISGFRVALGGMAEILKIQPDLVCYGKILGGGFPVGCYAGRADLMDLVAPLGAVYQAGTLSANPIGMVAGLATLKKMERTQGWKTLEERTSKFSKSLQQLFAKKGLQKQLVTFGSLFWICEKTAEPIRRIDAISKNQGPGFRDMFLKALDAGIYLAPNAFEVGFVSLAHSDAILLECAQKIGDLS